MKLLIHGRNLELTPSLRDYTKTKIDKATHNFHEMVQEADVHLSVARNPRVPQQTAEVTVFANGTVIRAQERSENLYASIDLVANKLARQLRKYKERHNNHHIHNDFSTKSIQNEEPFENLSLDVEEQQQEEQSRNSPAKALSLLLRPPLPERAPRRL